MINQLKRTQVPLTFVGNSTQVRIAQVVTALLAEQCCDNMVIMAEQCCWTNNVHCCCNNVVHHWRSNNGCSRLLKQETILLIEQPCLVHCSGFSFYTYNKPIGIWWTYDQPITFFVYDSEIVAKAFKIYSFSEKAFFAPVTEPCRTICPVFHVYFWQH